MITKSTCLNLGVSVGPGWCIFSKCMCKTKYKSPPIVPFPAFSVADYFNFTRSLPPRLNYLINI